MIKTFQFGLLLPVDGFDQSVLDVLFLRNQLWNNLVALERENREKYRALMLSSSEELASLQTRIDETESARERLVAEKKSLRASVRSKKVDTSVIDASVERLIAERNALRSRAKEVREAIKEVIKPQAAALSQERYEAVKRLSAESGLWWCNSETVIAAYDVARVKAMKENTELRFHSFDGTGKLAVRASGGFPSEDMFAGKLSFVRIKALPESEFAHLSGRGRRSKARHHLTMTVYTSKDEASGKKYRHDVTWPIVMHRDLPEGTVKSVAVHRKRVGNRFDWTCSITIDVEETPKTLLDHPSRSACGIDLGFRIVPGGLRVATVVDANTTEHIVLPQEWLDAVNYVEALQARLSDDDNATWLKLKPILASHKSWPEDMVQRIEKSLHLTDKTPVKTMRWLHARLRAEPDLAPTALKELDDHSNATHKRYAEMHNLRSKLHGRRKHIYRNVAARIGQAYSLVRIEDLDLRKLAMVKLENGADNDLQAAARKNRQRAALYELVLSIAHACGKSGALFEKMEPANSTLSCSECGAINEVSMDIHFTCKGCGTVHDQDENAGRNFLHGGYLVHKNQAVA